MGLGLWENLDDLPNNNRRQNDDTEVEEIHEPHDQSDNDDNDNYNDDYMPGNSGGG